MGNSFQLISVGFSITNILLALILGFYCKKENFIYGCIWWSVGFLLFGLGLLMPMLAEPHTLCAFTNAGTNLFFVMGILSIYNANMQFFGKHSPLQNILLFLIVYLFASFLLIALDLSLIHWAVSSLSISIISGLNGRVMLSCEEQTPHKLSRFIFMIFILFALFFFGNSVLLFLSSAGISQINLATARMSTGSIIVACSWLWTLGFILCIEDRAKKTTDSVREIYDLTINTIPDAVLITRLRDGCIVKVNEGYVKLTGYTEKESLGKTTLELNLWENPVDRQNLVILITDCGSIENKDYVFCRKNGRPLTGLLSARSITLYGEEHLLSVVRDITSRKKMEEKLRENEEKYRFLTENSSDVIWHINKSYRIDYISPADEKIRGFKREEVFGQTIWNIFKPEGVKLIREKIEHHHHVEKVGDNTNITRFEIEQQCKDGGWIWTEITAAPHYDNQGNLIGYHGISRDISEQKLLLEQLQRQATIDELTQVSNRAHFMTLAEKEIQRAKRYHHPVSLIIFDFDGLKGINDTYGHLAGDRALATFAKIVRTLIREVDILGRFGGDEFLLLLPETEIHDAKHVLDRIQNVSSASPIVFQGEKFNISISAGVAGLQEWTDSLNDILNRADIDLYNHKNLNCGHA